MIKTTPVQNKALVLESFDMLFNKRDYNAAERMRAADPANVVLMPLKALLDQGPHAFRGGPACALNLNCPTAPRDPAGAAALDELLHGA